MLAAVYAVAELFPVVATEDGRLRGLMSGGVAEKTTKKPVRKRASKKESRPNVPPKTAAELRITCGTVVDGVKCGKPVVRFDYQLGERNHMAGFVCDEHRVSSRVGKLAVKQTAAG